MGLDMFLFRKNKAADSRDIGEEVMYWRKANQIRGWFANNLEDGVENCVRSYVTKENLENLVNVCTVVLNDHSEAEKLLPTSYGFFFGPTEYDECYFDDLKETVEELGAIISETNWDNQEIYYYEWW